MVVRLQSCSRWRNAPAVSAGSQIPAPLPGRIARTEPLQLSMAAFLACLLRILRLLHVFPLLMLLSKLPFLTATSTKLFITSSTRATARSLPVVSETTKEREMPSPCPTTRRNILGQDFLVLTLFYIVFCAVHTEPMPVVAGLDYGVVNKKNLLFVWPRLLGLQHFKKPPKKIK